MLQAPTGLPKLAVLVLVLARLQVALQLPLVPAAQVPVVLWLVWVVPKMVCGRVQLVIKLVLVLQLAVTPPLPELVHVLVPMLMVVVVLLVVGRLQVAVQVPVNPAAHAAVALPLVSVALKTRRWVVQLLLVWTSHAAV